MNESHKVLITGASGLLGRSLIKEFINGGWFVYAQFHKNRGTDSTSCKWIHGDFSTLTTTRKFVDNHNVKLMECRVLINNFGPMTYKDTALVTSEDILSDFQSNLISANEISKSMLRSGRLHSVVNVGFEGAGDIKAYKNILPYAIAKSGLQILTLSYDREIKGTRFLFVSPPSIEGAEFRKASDEVVKPEEIAIKIYGMIDEGNHV